MKAIATEKQRESLKELIQTELLKRGFTAKIKTFEETERNNRAFIEFETESFQTTPVIFKDIKITNFSSSIEEERVVRDDKTSYNVKRFWIQVNVSYSSFSGGSNGENLFDLTGNFHEDHSNIGYYNIR